jgi:sugar-specific transcriptional regulator TrmB
MAVNGELLNLLKRVGLNQYESSIYSALLASGTSTAGELSSVANVPRSRVYDVLTDLEKKGFAIIQMGRPVKYMATPPENIVDNIKSNFEKEYKKKLEEFNRMESRLLKGLGSLKPKGKNISDDANTIGVIKGKANLYGHLKQLINSSEKNIIKVTDADGLIHFEKHCRSPLEKARKRGVNAKILADISSIDDLDKDAQRLKDSAELRKMSAKGGRFFVIDGKEAVLVTSPQDIGVWIRNPSLAGCLENLFNSAWEKGKSV